MSFNLSCLFSGHKPGYYVGKDDHGRCVQEFTCSRCGAAIPKKLMTPHTFYDWNLIEYLCNANSPIHLLRKRESRKCSTCSYTQYRDEVVPLDSLTPELGMHPREDGCNRMILCPKCGRSFYRKVSEHEYSDPSYKYYDRESCHHILTCKNCSAIQYVGEPVPHEFATKRLNDPASPCVEKKTTCQHCGFSRVEHDHTFEDVDQKLVKEVDSRDYHGGWVYWYDVTRRCRRCGLTIQVEAMAVPDVRELSYAEYVPTAR